MNRYHNHIDPAIKRDPINPEEEKVIFQKYDEHGNKWAHIAASLEGRTDNNVKNHFYSTLRRKIRKINKILKKNFAKEDIGKLIVPLTTLEGCEVTYDKIYEMVKNKELSYQEIQQMDAKNQSWDRFIKRTKIFRTEQASREPQGTHP